MALNTIYERNETKKFIELSENYKKYGADYYSKPENMPEICRYIVKNDILGLMNAIDSGGSIDVYDYFGNGPFHIAVIKNNRLILDYLISKGTEDINQQNFRGETALFIASATKKYNLAEKLISVGADPNIPDHLYASPLHMAICSPQMAQRLIEHGADTDKRDLFGRTPMHLAVDLGCLETLCLLLYYNADAQIPNGNNYTPFMVALEKKDFSMQETLFEYEDDYDVMTTDTELSMLGLAIRRESPFADEMILRGADVNNVNRYNNGAFGLTLHYSEVGGAITVNTFKLVWERIDYKPFENSSVLGCLVLYELDLQIFQEIVDLLINSRKFPVVAESLCRVDDFIPFVGMYIEHNLPLRQITELYSLLLTHGYTPSDHDLALFYSYWGYCEIFKYSLYMDIRRSGLRITGRMLTRLICDVNCSTSELLDEVVEMVKSTYCAMMKIVVFHVLDYCIYPPLLKAYTKKGTNDCITLKIMALPKVPSLLELARNQTREHIKSTYKVVTPCQFFTLINNLDIQQCYKKILKFENILYRPCFTQAQFEKYFSVLEATVTTREMIKSARRNAILIINRYLIDFQ